MKVEMQFFGYFFSASAKKVRELKIMSFFHRLKCLDKLNYSSPRFGYDPSLLVAKKAAGRYKDLDDIQNLGPS